MSAKIFGGIRQAVGAVSNTESEQGLLKGNAYTYATDDDDDDDDESHGGSEWNPSRYSTQKLYRNFLVMSIAFSCNHGCVVSCLAYATAQLGNELGGYGSGCLYVCYALTAFLFSKPICAMIGPKNGLLLGVIGYCVYVVGFLLAVLFPTIAWPVFLISASTGGCAGGLLWTAQGRYFASNAKLYSVAANIPVDQANATFAGLFSLCYLGIETITKVLATVIFLSTTKAPFIVFTVYSAIALASCFLMWIIHDLNESGSWDISISFIFANATSAARAVVSDSRLALMIPFQVAFGFASSFVPYYVLGTVIGQSPELGKTWVGLLSAIIVLTGASIAVPVAILANRIGKPLVMSFGGLCLALTGLLFFVVTNLQLGTWAGIVPFLIMYGIGRGVWENTNKAVIADFFSESPDFSTASFAAVSFANGVAGSIGYFTFSLMDRLQMAGLVAASSALAIICYLVAVEIHKARIGDAFESVIPSSDYKSTRK